MMAATFVPCSVGRAPHKWKPSETVHTSQGRVTFHICAMCSKREDVDDEGLHPYTRDYSDMERVYREGIVGKRAPSLMVANGKMVLSMLPAGDERRSLIDPTKAYLVSPERITEVEE